MKKYEYKVWFRDIPLPLSRKKAEETAQELERELNRLGGEGWELIQWKDCAALFKRELP